MTEPKQLSGIPEDQRSSYTFKTGLFSVTYSTAALLTSTLIYWNCHEKLGIKVPELLNPIDRYLYTVKLSLFSLIPLVASICHVMSIRIINPYARNPLAGHEYHVEKPKRILTNTVEQLIFNLVNLLIFSIVIKSQFVFWIPYLVFCFVIGRVTFHIGYLIHPRYRVFGFVWTFFTTLLIFLYNCANVGGLVG